MTKRQLMQAIHDRIRDAGLKKEVKPYEHVIHVSDDAGNKKDFYIKTPNKEVVYTHGDVEIIVNATIDAIKDAYADGEEINIAGFGIFKLAYYPPRVVRNPVTGEPMTTKGKYTPRFKANKGLRDAAEIYSQRVRDREFSRILDDKKIDVTYDYEGDK